jgi:hypothetical protein
MNGLRKITQKKTSVGIARKLSETQTRSSHDYKPTCWVCSDVHRGLEESHGVKQVHHYLRSDRIVTE